MTGSSPHGLHWHRYWCDWEVESDCCSLDSCFPWSARCQRWSKCCLCDDDNHFENRQIRSNRNKVNESKLYVCVWEYPLHLFLVVLCFSSRLSIVCFLRFLSFSPIFFLACVDDFWIQKKIFHRLHLSSSILLIPFPPLSIFFRQLPVALCLAQQLLHRCSAGASGFHSPWRRKFLSGCAAQGDADIREDFCGDCKDSRGEFRISHSTRCRWDATGDDNVHIRRRGVSWKAQSRKIFRISQW